MHEDDAAKAARAPFWRRMWGAAAGALGLGLALAPPAPAQAQAAVPQHWISYAQLVSNQFQAWLADPDNDAVVRLHERMQQRVLESNGSPAAPVIVRVWVSNAGRVERVAFDTLGDERADQDLRAILTAQPLSEPPPPDMRQPMVLRLKLDFAT